KGFGSGKPGQSAVRSRSDVWRAQPEIGIDTEIFVELRPGLELHASGKLGTYGFEGFRIARGMAAYAIRDVVGEVFSTLNSSCHRWCYCGRLLVFDRFEDWRNGTDNFTQKVPFRLRYFIFHGFQRTEVGNNSDEIFVSHIPERHHQRQRSRAVGFDAVPHH